MAEKHTENKKNHSVDYDYTSIDIKPLQVSFDEKQKLGIDNCGSIVSGFVNFVFVVLL